MRIEEFEIKVLRELCAGVVPGSVLNTAIFSPDEVLYKYTGDCYQLEIRHSDIVGNDFGDAEREVRGIFQGHEVYFTAYVEEGLICLECYSSEVFGVPEGIRHGAVEIQTT